MKQKQITMIWAGVTLVILFALKNIHGSFQAVIDYIKAGLQKR